MGKSKINQMLLAVLVLAAVLPFVLCDKSAAFDYNDVLGWPSLADNSCGSRVRQSPVNLDHAQTAPEATFLLQDSAQNVMEAFVNGKPLEMDLSILPIGFQLSPTVTAPTETLISRYRDVNYKFLQVHFHAPSEHRLAGRFFPADAHFVHQAVDDDSKLMVIGVFFDIQSSAHSPFIQSLIDGAGLSSEARDPVDEPITLDFADFIRSEIGADSQVSLYAGSLTTPPCSEVVQWIHYQNAVSISVDQWYQILNLIGHFNSRPTQPRAIVWPMGRFATLMSGDAVSGSEWSYEGNSGVAVWSERFPECGGNRQSPVDVGLAAFADFIVYDDDVLEAVRWSFVGGVSVSRKDFAITLDFSGISDGPSVVVDGEYYVMKYMQAHFVSEHRVKGKFYPMELVVIHEHADSRKRVAISMFFDISGAEESTPIVKPLADFARSDVETSVVSVDLEELQSLIFSNDSFFVYNGSLTTPPCTENVKYFVKKSPLVVNVSDWKDMATSYNSRPLIGRH